MRIAIMAAGLAATAFVVATVAGQARGQTAERTQQIAEELARKMAQQHAVSGETASSPQASVSIPYYIPGQDLYAQRSTVPPANERKVLPSERTYDLPSTTYRSLTDLQ